MNLENIKVGDKFFAPEYHEHGGGIKSAFNYLVIKAGKRDIRCHALSNGEPIRWTGNGEIREFVFKRTSEVYEIGAPEIIKMRKEIAFKNHQSQYSSFLRSTSHAKFDAEFMDAIEAFKKRIAPEQPA